MKDYELIEKEIDGTIHYYAEYSAQVEHPGRLKLNTLVAFG